MAQAVKRRRPKTSPQPAGGSLLSLLAIIVLLVGGFYYIFPAITSGDLLWFSTQFDAEPRLMTVIDRGQRIEIEPSDPRFQALVDAFNTSITRGYRSASMGFSEETRKLVDQNGLLVEALYAEPVRLHVRGGFTPTKRLQILVSGNNIHTTQALFRSNEANWDPIPLILSDLSPLKAELTRQGFDT